MQNFTTTSLHAISGIAIFVFIIFFVRSKQIKHGFTSHWWQLIRCVVLQLAVCFLLMKAPIIVESFRYITEAFQFLIKSTNKAVTFVFGGLASPPPESGLGFILALQVLPNLILISALGAFLMHIGILPYFVRIAAIVLHKITGINSRISTGAMTGVFFGMNENAVVLKQYLPRYASSELMTLMIIGMSTMSPAMFAIFEAMYGKMIPNLMQYMVTSSLLNIVGAMWICGTMSKKREEDTYNWSFERYNGVLDAIIHGTLSGARVVVIICAMLIGFLSLLHLLDYVLAIFSVGDAPLSLQRIMGWILTPITYIMGADNPDVVAKIVGIKITMNEMIAYREMSESFISMTFNDQILSLFCINNFCNITSMAGLIGTYSSLLPDRKFEIAKSMPRAFCITLLNTFLTATIMGMVMRS